MILFSSLSADQLTKLISEQSVTPLINESKQEKNFSLRSSLNFSRSSFVRTVSNVKYSRDLMNIFTAWKAEEKYFPNKSKTMKFTLVKLQFTLSVRQRSKQHWI